MEHIKQGRPTRVYEESIGKEICELMEDGESLDASIKRMDVSKATVYKWLRENKDFLDLYTRARSNQADSFNSQIHQLRDQMINGDISPEVCRIATDSLKWQAGKQQPRLYGDRIDIGNGAGLVINIIRGDVPASLPDTALDADFNDISD